MVMILWEFIVWYIVNIVVFREVGMYCVIRIMIIMVEWECRNILW